MGIPAIYSTGLAAAQTIGGLLSPRHSQYDALAQKYAGQQQGYLGDESGLRDSYSQLAAQNRSQYGIDNDKSNQYLTGLENYDNTDPYTDAYSQQQLAASTNGAYRDEQQAQANTAASLAQRGIGDSSVAAGATAGINSNFMGQMAGARNNLALQAISQQASRKQALANMFSSASQRDLGNASSEMGAQGNYDSSLQGIYGNMAQYNRGLDNQYVAQRQQDIYGGAQGIGDGLGGLMKQFGGGSSPSLGGSGWTAASSPNGTTTFTGGGTGSGTGGGLINFDTTGALNGNALGYPPGVTGYF